VRISARKKSNKFKNFNIFKYKYIYITFSKFSPFDVCTKYIMKALFTAALNFVVEIIKSCYYLRTLICNNGNKYYIILKKIVTAKSDWFHGARRRWRTCDMCLPRLLCTLQHSSQIKTPLLIEAQSGSKYNKCY